MRIDFRNLSVEIWFNDCNNYFGISLVNNFKIKFCTNNAIKHIDSIYDFNFLLGPICFNYTNFNYNDIIYCIVKSTDRYDKNIIKFNEALNVWAIDNNSSIPSKLFKYNWEKIDDVIYYYIRINKNILYDMNLSNIIKHQNKEEIIKNIDKFPK